MTPIKGNHLNETRRRIKHNHVDEPISLHQNVQSRRN